MATLFSNLRLPPRKEGPVDLEHFKEDFIRPLYNDPFIMQFWAVASPIIGCLLGYFVSTHAGVVTGIAAGLFLAWLTISGPVFLAYATACCDYGGMSLVWLPWRQRWTWTLVVSTLPWAVFWLTSALRLAINRNKTRPDQLPLNHGA